MKSDPIISFPKEIFLFSFLILGFIGMCWKKRKATGFFFGKEVQSFLLNEIELCQLIGKLLLAYSLILIAVFAVEEFHLLQNDDRRAFLLIIFQTLFYSIFLRLIHRLLKHKDASWSHAFGFQSTTLRNILITSAVSLCAILLPLQILTWMTYFVFDVFHWQMEPQFIVRLLMKLHNPWLYALVAIIAIGGAPFVEEIFFRGLIYPQLKKRFGFTHALWINAMLFSLFHVHVASILPLFGLGIALTLLYEWRGNLGASMLFHAGYNSLSLGMLFWVKNHLV